MADIRVHCDGMGHFSFGTGIPRFESGWIQCLNIRTEFLKDCLNNKDLEIDCEYNMEKGSVNPLASFSVQGIMAKLYGQRNMPS